MTRVPKTKEENTLDEHIELAYKTLTGPVIEVPQNHGDGSYTGCVDINGNVQGPYWWVCHRKIANMKEPNVYFSKILFPKRNYGATKAAMNWYKFILDPNISPFRSILKIMNENGPKMMEDGTDIRSLKFMLKHGFIVWDLDRIPSNLLAVFMIATRFPREFPHWVKTWNILVKDHKIDPALAYIFTIMYAGNISSKSYNRIHTINHFDVSMDHATCDVDYILNFKNGILCTENLRAPYSEVQEYKPANQIWGNNKLSTGSSDNKNKSYLYLLYDKYGKKLGRQAKNSWSGVEEKGIHYWELKPEEWINLVKEECDYLLKLDQERKEKSGNVSNMEA